MSKPASEPHRSARRNWPAEFSLFFAVFVLVSMFALNGPYMTEIAVLDAVAAPLAIILGVIARGRARDEAGDRYFASLGIVIVSSSVAMTCLMPSVCRMGESTYRAQFTNNLKQVALALHSYASAHGGRLPPAVVRDGAGRPLYSWRVLILPYIEEQALYDQFHLDEPWDSPHNRALLDRAPAVYRGIGVGGRDESLIQAFVGPGSAFDDPQGVPFVGKAGNAAFPDGAYATVLVAEAGEGVPWSAPLDLPFEAAGPVPPLGEGYRRDRGLFRSTRVSRTCSMVFGDGRVKAIEKAQLTPATLRAFVTRNGGDQIANDLLR